MVRTWVALAIALRIQASRRPLSGRLQHNPQQHPRPPPACLAEDRITMYRASTHIDADSSWAFTANSSKVREMCVLLISKTGILDCYLEYKHTRFVKWKTWWNQGFQLTFCYNLKRCKRTDLCRITYGTSNWKNLLFLPPPCFIVGLYYFAIILIVWLNTSTENICKETCI